MNLGYFLVLLTTTGVMSGNVRTPTSTTTTTVVEASVDSPFCRLIGSHLHCDFKSYDYIVQVGQSAENSVERVIIRSALRVEVRFDICVNLSFVDVLRVTLQEYGSPSNHYTPASTCQGINIIIHNSSVEKLPRHTHGISVTSSYVRHLPLTRPRGYLVSTMSVFGVADINEPVANQVLYFKDSVIQNLTRLELTSKTSLYLVNTTVLHHRPRALSVGSGSSLYIIRSDGFNLNGTIDLKPGSMVNIYSPASEVSFAVSSLNQSENMISTSYELPQNLTERCLINHESLSEDITYVFVLLILLLLPGNVYLCICLVRSMTGSPAFVNYLLLNEKTSK
ncbi:uncharacterized protein LOC135203033 [Macrobrachium nipponense]|uniref:uncharacterized protein LOC135203033 n=1 Tax=Macrobrachium nipponense TaxID=159736 RepID=UPI0030C7B6D5